MKHMKASLALALSFLLLPLGALAQTGGEDDGGKRDGAKRPPKPPRDGKAQEAPAGS